MVKNGDSGGAELNEQLRYESKIAPLRLMICGSVDDDKYALLGHLFSDIATLSNERSAEPELDYSPEVSFRLFSTSRRTFSIADAPRHRQDTSNMVAASSDVDLAIFLVDATNGLLAQTRRHAYIASLMGIRHLVLAINNMESVQFSQFDFDSVRENFESFAGQLAVNDVATVPISALEGDNIIELSPHMDWYTGPSLREILETKSVEQDADSPMRMLVQRIVCPDQNIRGCAGVIEIGSVRVGDSIIALPSGVTTSVARIVTVDGDCNYAAAGQAVTLMLNTNTGISQGDVIAAAVGAPEQADQFAVHLVWLNEQPLYPGRSYQVKIGNLTLTGQITELKYRVDMISLDRLAAPHLDENEVGYGTLAIDQAISFEPYEKCKTLGEFNLIDPATNTIVGRGIINFALWRATTIPWQNLEINKAARAEHNGQKPVVLWFTGLSGAGKSTVANEISKRLHLRGKITYLLDGDNLRHGLNRDLGFRPQDRVENVRRVGEVAKLFVDAGLIVLASLISPFRSERAMVRNMVEPDEFIEIFVQTPIEECERRDNKGLYARARAGEIRNFTGIESPYEPPDNPELVLNTIAATPTDLADQVFALLEERGII